MTKFFVAGLLALIASFAHAGSYYVGAGYDFIPGSADAFFGYQTESNALEVMVLHRGKEEPLTKPGPQISVDGVQYVHLSFLLPLQPFLKAGLVTGGSGTRGFNAGAGFDMPLAGHWFVRGQAIRYWATEDYDQGMEAENLISLGIKYAF